MKIALYNEDPVEQAEMQNYLQEAVKKIGEECDITVFRNHIELYNAFHEAQKDFDLIVVANNGTIALEMIEMICRQIQDARKIIWFSDLDFSLRSYKYGVAWFGVKPVNQEVMNKAFFRVISYHSPLA